MTLRKARTNHLAEFWHYITALKAGLFQEYITRSAAISGHSPEGWGEAATHSKYSQRHHQVPVAKGRCLLSFSVPFPSGCAHSFLGNQLSEVSSLVEPKSQGSISGIMRPSYPHYFAPSGWEEDQCPREKNDFTVAVTDISFTLTIDLGKHDAGWTSMWPQGSVSNQIY